MATDFPTYPATTFEQAVELAIFSSNQLHQVINSDGTSEVETENGDIPSVRKALIDNLYFKAPSLDWVEGTTSTVFNQLYTFTGGTTGTALWYAPTATTSNPVLLEKSPEEDDNWRLFGWDTYSKKQLNSTNGASYIGTSDGNDVQTFIDEAQDNYIKSEVARDFGVKLDKVAILSTDTSIDNYSLLYNPDTETIFYKGLATGTPSSWSVTDEVMTLVTSAGTFTLYSASQVYMGDYSESILSLTSDKQYITYLGEEYKLKSSVSSFTTTGTTSATWESDKSNFVEKEDYTLREDLTTIGSNLAADLIPLPQGGTVLDGLDKLITPEMFGAVGDGTTDDTSATQAAATYADNLGYPLVLGTMYLISTPITANNIIGRGDNCGFIIPSTFTGDYGITCIATQTLKASYQRLYFKNSSTVPALFVNKTWTSTIFFNLYIDNCYFTCDNLTGTGLKVYGAQGHIANNTFKGIGTITSNESKAIWFSGDSSGGAMNIQVVGCSIMGWGYGIYAVSTHFGLTEGLGIKVCNITGCRQGMWVKNIADYRVLGCMIDNNDQGLYLENAYPLDVSHSYLMARYSNKTSYTDYEPAVIFYTNTQSTSGHMAITISNNYLLPSSTGVALAAGIVIAGTSGYPILSPKIRDNNFELFYRSVVLRYTQSAVISGCYMKATYTNTNIHIPSTNANAFISDCVFLGKYGIVNQTGTPVMVDRCNFVNVSNTYPMLSTVSSHNIIASQCLYNGARTQFRHTQNITTTAAITSYSVAHGLGYAPTLAITASTNSASAIVSYIVCDATNITVYFASSVPSATAFNLSLAAELDLTAVTAVTT